MGDTVNLSALLNQPIARSVAAARRDGRAHAQRSSEKTEPSPWYRIRNEAGDDTAEILIYDFIDPDPWFGGVSAQDFVRDLTMVDAKNLTVRINSPGGDVYDAIAITNALRNHDAHVTVMIDGLAASAASFIAMAGDEVVMCPNAEMMIHDARGFCVGSASDVAEYAEWLNRCSDNIAQIYAAKAGGEASDWRAAMSAETWYSDAEAVEAGLADRVHDSGNETAGAAAARFEPNLRAFAHAGRRRQASAPFIPAAVAVGPSRKEAPVATLKEGLAERLGIDADADDETTLKALEEALAERADNTDGGGDGGGEPSLDNLNQAAAKLGMRLVNSERLDTMESRLAAGEQARAQQLADHRESVVNEAIRLGKIAPAQKTNFIALMEKDAEGTEKFLADLPKEAAVPMTELGHSTEPTDVTDKTVREDAEYKGWSL